MISKSKRKEVSDFEQIKICQFCILNKKLKDKFKKELNEMIIPQIFELFETKYKDIVVQKEETEKSSQKLFDQIKLNLLFFEKKFRELKNKNKNLVKILKMEIQSKEEINEMFQQLSDLVFNKNVKEMNQFLNFMIENEGNILSVSQSIHYLDYIMKNLNIEMK